MFVSGETPESTEIDFLGVKGTKIETIYSAKASGGDIVNRSIGAAKKYLKIIESSTGNVTIEGLGTMPFSNFKTQYLTGVNIDNLSAFGVVGRGAKASSYTHVELSISLNEIRTEMTKWLYKR